MNMFPLSFQGYIILRAGLLQHIWTNVHETWHAVIFECVRFEKQVDSVSHVGTLYVLELRMKLDGHIDQRNKKSKLVERWTIFLLEAEEEAECGRGNCWKKERTRQNRMNKGRLALIKICTIFRP